MRTDVSRAAKFGLIEDLDALVKSGVSACLNLYTRSGRQTRENVIFDKIVVRVSWYTPQVLLYPLAVVDKLAIKWEKKTVPTSVHAIPVILVDSRQILNTWMGKS